MQASDAVPQFEASASEVPPLGTQMVERELERGPAAFIAAAWQGQFGLPRTYWVGGVVGGLVWTGVFAFLAANAESNLNFAWLTILLFPVWLAYTIMVLIGIWRAATNYTGPRFWAGWAKLVVVLGWCRLLIELKGLFE